MTTAYIHYGKYKFTNPYKKLEEMSVEELEILKDTWWKETRSNKLAEDCNLVKEKNLLSNRPFSSLHINADYLHDEEYNILIGPKIVYSGSDCLCVPGLWCKEIENLISDYRSKLKKDLVEELSLDISSK